MKISNRQNYYNRVFSDRLWIPVVIFGLFFGAVLSIFGQAFLGWGSGGPSPSESNSTVLISNTAEPVSSSQSSSSGFNLEALSDDEYVTIEECGVELRFKKGFEVVDGIKVNTDAEVYTTLSNGLDIYLTESKDEHGEIDVNFGYEHLPSITCYDGQKNVSWENIEVSYYRNGYLKEEVKFLKKV